MASSEDSIRKFLRVTSNEFLRFNDLKPGTSPQAWWLSVALLIALTCVVQSLQWLVDGFLPAASIAIESLAKALLAFFVIPISSAYMRRLSDSRAFGPAFKVWFGLRATRAGAVYFWAIGLATGLVIAYLVFSLPFWVLSALLILALLPENENSNVPIRTTVHANIKLPPTLASAPPTLTSTPPPTINPPALKPFASSSSLPEPSKKLVQRVGFWLSVALAVLTLLAPLQSDVERIFEDFQSPAPSEQPSPSQEPTPTQSPTVSPTTSPVTQSPATDSSGVGAGAGAGIDDDDTVVVVPVEEDQDVAGLDPRFRYCTHAIAAGYGPYVYGVDPEYDWYNDRDGDGIVCER